MYLLPQLFFHLLAIGACFRRKEIGNAEILAGEGGIVKYNIVRNVVKFNWATELMIYIKGDIGGDLVYKNGFMISFWYTSISS